MSVTSRNTASAPNGYFPGTRTTRRRSRQIVRFEDGDPPPAPLVHPDITSSPNYSYGTPPKSKVSIVSRNSDDLYGEETQSLKEENAQLRTLVADLCSQRIRRSHGMRFLARIRRHTRSRSMTSQAMTSMTEKSHGIRETSVEWEDPEFSIVTETPSKERENSMRDTPIDEDQTTKKLKTTLTIDSEFDTTTAPKNSMTISDPMATENKQMTETANASVSKDTANGQVVKDTKENEPKPKKSGARNWIARKLSRASTSFIRHRS